VTHGWLSVLFATLALVVSRVAMGRETAMPERVVLEGVDQYRVVEPIAEGVRVILNYRGEAYSPAYVAGISGSAFKVGGPCPCAPTSWGTVPPHELARAFGYEADWIDIGAPYGDPGNRAAASAQEQEKRLQTALFRIKSEIRAERPALLVQAFTNWEFDVVCGFDEGKHELYGRGSYTAMRVPEYTHADELHALGATDIGGGPYAVLIRGKTGTFDAKAAELAALRGAVAHANTRAAGKGLPMGLECYDLWIDQYRHQGSHMAPTGLPGDGYPLSILPSTRRAASQFTAELAAKYPQAKANLESAAEDFAAESEALAAAQKLRESIIGEGTSEQCARMAGLLSRARAMYALAIDEIARALPSMEAQ
jgi:hypothetical protein